MPECEWWEVFDVDREELGFLVVGMRSVENYLRKIKEDMPDLSVGMPTRKSIDIELQRRGVGGGNDNAEVDEEQQLMDMMDSR
jgi:uncharacterized short protein YbdD (DUF466 family)